MTSPNINYSELAQQITLWSQELGFSQIGFSDVDLTAHESALEQWLANGYHGNMDYMQRHGLMRARPAELVPGTLTAISVRLDYMPSEAKCAHILKTKDHAYISRYALGRDYHKLMRKRLQQLGKKISAHFDILQSDTFNFRPFVDSAPILERPLAEKAGLGWVGKHSLLLNKQAGSWFFIGELLIDIPLATQMYTNNIPPSSASNDAKDDKGCGSCVACIKICPTNAIVEPYVVDARRCISYFTIESPDPIPLELRPLMGNRIYGCDDCQLICPWNKYSKLSLEEDFQPRLSLDKVSLLTLFAWDEQYFDSALQGSPIRRIGFDSWQRNIAVALGNAPYQEAIVNALRQKLASSSELVCEHIEWAIMQQLNKKEVIEVSHPNINNAGDKSAQKNERLTARLIRSIEKGLPRDA
jgi:epoxyqueuosine reductase